MPLFRPTKPRWVVGFTAVHSKPAGASDVPWDELVEGDEGLWDAGAPTIVTINRAGWYLLQGQVGRAAVAVPSSISARLQRNGVNLSSSGTGVSTTATQQSATMWQGSLEVGDEISFDVTLHGTIASDYQQALTWMRGARIGPVAWTG